MASLEAWENIVATEINGAPLPTMIDAVREAAIEFCQRTLIHVEIFEDLPYNVEVLIPDSDAHTTPSKAMNVWVRGRLLTPATRPELEQHYPHGWPSAIGRPVFWTSPRPSVIRLVPKTAEHAPLTIEAAMQPKRNATSVADFLYELYAREIGHGAVAILHAHSDAGYAQPERAGTYRALFLEATERLAHDRSGHQQQHLRTGADRIV